MTQRRLSVSRRRHAGLRPARPRPEGQELFRAVYTGQPPPRSRKSSPSSPRNCCGAVAGITATAQDGSPAHLELLLLPFNTRAHTPISLTGLLAPFGDAHSVLSDFKLTSWRYLAHPPQRLVPRALKKLAVARGLMVYEGLR